jgi:hypothetical protein
VAEEHTLPVPELDPQPPLAADRVDPGEGDRRRDRVRPAEQVDAGLRVIDVSSASAPIEIGDVDTPGRAYGVAANSGLAFVAVDEAGMAIIRECDLFSDGFESGDTSGWSATVP